MSTAHLQAQFGKTAENLFNNMPPMSDQMAMVFQAAGSAMGDPMSSLQAAGMFLKSHIDIPEARLGTGGLNPGHTVLQASAGQAADIAKANAAAATAALPGQ